MAVQDVINSDLLAQIKQLSISERIFIVEDIWDSIALSSAELAITPEQKKDLDKRYLDYKNNPEDGSSWQEVKSGIETDYRRNFP